MRQLYSVLTIYAHHDQAQPWTARKADWLSTGHRGAHQLADPDQRHDLFSHARARLRSYGSVMSSPSTRPRFSLSECRFPPIRTVSRAAPIHWIGAPFSPLLDQGDGAAPLGVDTRPLADTSPRKSSVPHQGPSGATEAVPRLLARRHTAVVHPTSARWQRRLGHNRCSRRLLVLARVR
jgi:hypothetical protein